MSKQVFVELYCPECEYEVVLDHREYECPRCESMSVFISDFIICDCQERVYLPNVTNVCKRCGRYYNGFGQELLPPDEWDPDDRYSLLGPDCPDDFD